MIGNGFKEGDIVVAVDDYYADNGIVKGTRMVVTNIEWRSFSDVIVCKRLDGGVILRAATGTEMSGERVCFGNCFKLDVFMNACREAISAEE